MKYIALLIWCFAWVVGAVLAKGFWSNFAAVATGGLWSAYLIAEKLMTAYGVI